MPATPAITLTATPQTITGSAAGSAANPAKLLIVLCGFGLTPPSVAGTSILSQIAYSASSTGSAISVALWGNDVITPANTFYQITVLDGNGNVVQTGAYLITGSGTIDLSNLTPITQPAPVVFLGYVAVNCQPTISFNGALGNVFDLTLNQNVTYTTAPNIPAGTFVEFIIAQDATGGHTFAWPSIVKNAPLINSAANSVSTNLFIKRADGYLYPANGWS